MKNLHFISGLPRSGSTLLCQILNMNPKFLATATSPVLDMLQSMQHVFSHNGSYKAVDRLEHYDNFADAQAAYLKTWYGVPNKTVFDKNRGWPMHLMRLDEILDNEDSKIIWTYRDPIQVISSMEKQHRKYSLIQHNEQATAQGAGMATLDGRIAAWTAEAGIVTFPMRALHEAVHTGYKDRIKIIDYKTLCSDTQKTMDDIHEFLELEPYSYNKNKWADLKQVTVEHDHLYNYKYPHQITQGEIKYSETEIKDMEGYTEIIKKRYEWMIKYCSDQINQNANQRVSREQRRKQKATMKKAS